MSYFNEEQQAYMRSLSKIPLEQRCYCGWFALGECPHCPEELTAAHKVERRCPSCHNYPPATDLSRPITHRIGCGNREIGVG